MSKLRDGKPSALADISVTLEPDYFTEKRFSISAVDSKTFVLLLVSAGPLSFVSGSPVSLAQVLADFNRSEFHHLMPQAFLNGLGFDTRQASPLANFAMISAVDNKALGGVAPSSYKAAMPSSATSQILAHALCPESLFMDDYETFLKERSRLLVDSADALMS